MRRESSVEEVPKAGRCTQAQGEVLICAPGGVEKPLLCDASFRTGDKVLAGENASAALKFTDGTMITLGPDSVLVIDAFAYESDTEEDAALLTAVMGTFVIETGDLAIQADNFTVSLGDSTCGLRCARIAARVDPLGYDMVTLLPALHGPLGEVLVHNKIGVQMLNRVCQTLRLGSGEADIPAPLTLPSGVIRETYAGPGVSDDLFPAGQPDKDEDLSEEFQPFRALHDRFLERQFMTRTVFPIDGPVMTGDGDEMLEDAFEGTRFRLSDPDPESSGG
ncbi:hypothetical protein L2D14_06360 [Thalassospiraceae bacterium LMO-JJ14]|nr:hypothetical protein L2D14_06360 [Thalassospiraceae bacterium LMO-JJ14]